MFVETKPEGEAAIINRWRISFLKAADLIERQGWCQDRTHNASGEHCLLGAVWFSHYGKEPPGGIVRELDWHEVFEILKPHTAPSIAGWNDAPERTKAEVIAALRAAAASPH
jgi:hypothetical protein